LNLPLAVSTRLPLPPRPDARNLRRGNSSTHPPLSRRAHGRNRRTAGWDKLKNGGLLEAAEEAGFEVLVTPDKNIRYQQNLVLRRIALVVLGNPQWPVLRRHVERVVLAVNAAQPGSYTVVDIPADIQNA